MITIRKKKLSLRDEVRSLLVKAKINDTIDLSEVEYISPSASHELLSYVRERKLKLINVRKEVREMLEIQMRVRKMKNMPEIIFVDSNSTQ